jgi:hypothetical protein
MPVASDAVISLKIENNLVKVCGPKVHMARLLQAQAILQLTSFIQGAGWVQKPQTKDGISEVHVRYKDKDMPEEPFTHVIKWLNKNGIRYKESQKKTRQRKARPRPRLLPRVNGDSHASHQ